MKVFAFVVALAAGAASAQSYPTKPIRLVVPFAPGGSSTLVARFMSEEMAKGLGTSFVIENKPGGGGNVAMIQVWDRLQVRIQQYLEVGSLRGEMSQCYRFS